ncbi:hypothetical protein VTK56DRAFT_6107 [Thermocarpiscus australiensis]
MSPHPAWRLLPVAAPDIPTLLVSTAFTADSYSVHLSDLANVWVESMDRRPIIKRGMVEDTSIDPSDGPDQIRKLLDLLRAAFDVNDREHPNTSLRLARDDDGDSLVVHVTCLLPEPLKPLKWPMHLKKCPQSTIATELVLPLIQAHEARAREIDHLISLLREKDGVITKLVDKLEVTGTGLEYVFNQLSGKRKVTRAAAEGRVKGLAPFSEVEYRAKAAEMRPVTQSSDVSALLGAVFGAKGLQYKADLELEASTALNNWWTKLAKGKSVILAQRSERKEREIRSPAQDAETNKDDEDDFQVQATPPGVKSTRKGGTHTQLTPADGDETTDGEDTEASAVLHRPPSVNVATKTSGSRLGAVGGRKRPSASPPHPSTSHKAATRKGAPAEADSETASEPDEDETDGSRPSSPPKPPPRRGGLGRIGGKPKQDAPATAPPRSPSPAAQADEPSPLPRRHKLGMIGKRPASPGPETSATSVGEDGRGRSKAPASEPKKEPPRETSQERADRKRAELQRDLEKRAAAGPAKKKRKF